MYNLKICLNHIKIIKVLGHYSHVWKYLTKPGLTCSHIKMYCLTKSCIPFVWFTFVLLKKTDSETKMTRQSNQGLFNNEWLFHFILLDVQELQGGGAFLLILFVHVGIIFFGTRI